MAKSYAAEFSDWTSKALIVISGGTGFVAGHCIKQLLERGSVKSPYPYPSGRVPFEYLRAHITPSYDVATTVRSHEKGKKVLGAHSAYADGKLSYRIVEDIASPDAFKEVRTHLR